MRPLFRPGELQGMAQARRGNTPRGTGIALGLLLLGSLATGAVVLTYRSGRDRGLPDNIPTATVRRIDLYSTVTEDGEVESTEKTTIECELKQLSFRNGGMSLDASGSSRIIELLPEGHPVKAGEVLCRLDGSVYEEMARQQLIELEEDRAELRSAQLQLETLEVALKEYRDGQVLQARQRMLGEIALARSDLERQKERLTWSQHMNRIGYIPRSRLSAEEGLTLKAEITLRQAEVALATFEKYTASKAIFELEGRIDMARSEVGFQAERVARDEQNLTDYRKQVERCTIRAPHDGLLIYAQDDDDDERIELGTIVREDQDLFYLPNLSKMEVQTKIHETSISRVRPGMPARVRIESLPNVLLEGTVIALAPLPVSIRSRYQSDEVKNFIGRVELHTIPAGLLPGMSAQVEIVTAQRPNTLVVPPDALAIEEGRSVCYVARGSAIERREVVAGESDLEHVEITDGLSEGDVVLLTPGRLDILPAAEPVESVASPNLAGEIASIPETQPAI